MYKHLLRFALALSTILLASCSSMENYNPFGDPKPPEARKPENSTEYQCDNGKRFFVRMLDKGNSAWLIYPNREINLDKVSGDSGTRYSNGIAILEINGTEATLNDGPSIAYTGCKSPVRK